MNDHEWYGEYGLIFTCATCGKPYEPDSPSGYYCIDESGIHDARAGDLVP